MPARLNSARRSAATAATIALAATGLAGLGNPTAAVTSSSIAVSVDGTSGSLASGYTLRTYAGNNADGSPRFTTSTVTAQPFGTGTLTELRPVKGGYLLEYVAQGGVVVKTGASCGTGIHYRRAQVTLSGLGTEAKDVWAFWDGTVGGNLQGAAPHWASPSDTVSVTATGTSGQSTVTVTDAGSVNIGDHVTGTGVGTGARITGIAGNVLTLSAANTADIASGTLTVVKRQTATSQLDTLCDGSTPWVAAATGFTGTAGTLDLDGAGSDAATAGLEIGNTTQASVSFDVWVPMQDGGAAALTGWSLTLGFVVDGDGDGAGAADAIGTLSDTYDTAIATTVNAPRPWDSITSADDVLLAACSSPAASDAPCYVAAGTGLFNSSGASSLGVTASVEALIAGTSIDVALRPTQPLTAGYSIPDGSVAKIQLSLPTSGTSSSVPWATTNYAQAAGDTKLLIDPAGAAATNTWSLATTGDRRVITVIGTAKRTSTAVNPDTGQEACSINMAVSPPQPIGCGTDASASLITDTVPATFHLGAGAEVLAAGISGGLVSTNGQTMEFGPEMQTGSSFQFAVAGPSVDATGASRSSSGFYYICVPAAFLSTFFGTTPAAAATTWEGTRDGSVVTGVGFGAGTCGTGLPGLVASYPTFGYSVPLFSVRPPRAETSDGSSGESTTPSATPTPSASASASAAPVAATVPAAAPQQAPRLPAAANRLTPAQAAALTPAQLATITPEQAGQLKPTVLAALSGSQLRALPAAAFSGLTAAQAGALKPAQVRALPAASIARLRASALEGLSESAVRSIRPSTLAALPKAAVAKVLRSLGPELTSKQRAALARLART